MEPALLFTRDVETVKVNEYLNLSLLTHGNWAVFDHLMKYGDPMAMTQVHPSIEMYAEHLLKPNRKIAGEEIEPGNRKELLKVNGGTPQFTYMFFDNIRSRPGQKPSSW